MSYRYYTSKSLVFLPKNIIGTFLNFQFSASKSLTFLSLLSAPFRRETPSFSAFLSACADNPSYRNVPIKKASNAQLYTCTDFLQKSLVGRRPNPLISTAFAAEILSVTTFRCCSFLTKTIQISPLKTYRFLRYTFAIFPE
jgi:hypothetical protein